MKFHGHIDLQENEMQQMVMRTEVSWPETPIVGRMIFKDKRVYICAEIVTGVPSWIPLTNEIDTHLHNQIGSSDTWTITHNLNTTSPLVQLYDELNKMILPNEVEVIDNNTVVVTLGTAITGRAIVMYGDITGAEKSQFAYTHVQTSTSTTWVIPHNLGYYPIVRVFIGTEEVQPQTVVHDSLFQTTITFSSTQVGTARLV